MMPAPLKNGATIGIVAPAKPADEKTLTSCVDQLHKRGFKTKVAPNALQKQGIFAGDEPFRAKSFMECWCDPEVDAVWCIHGGYGCTPLLDHLDFALLRRHPKVFIGMSDATALHAALTKQGLVTFLGPTLAYLFAEHRLRYLPYSEEALWQAVMDQSLQFTNFEVLKEGTAQGKLTGGNLALITALIGTPWQLDVKGKILILEDVNEAPYRIDRMLCQMKQCGFLEEVAAVILGSWQDCEGDDPTFSLPEVFARYFSKAKYPVASNFPTGHIPRQVTLPLNVEAELKDNCLKILNRD